MPLDVVEGWTGPIDMILKIDGSPALFSGSSDDVQLILRSADRQIISTTGEVYVLSATDGTVRFFPSIKDLVAARGPYLARYKHTDAEGRIVFFPNGAADVWTVYSA